MYEMTALIKRHMLRFLRDKAAVFFSFLSVLILISLYILFIGKQYTQGLEYLDKELRTALVVGVMMGGVLVINSMSLSLGMMGNIIEDLEHHALDAFLVTPAKRRYIILSYYLAAIIVTSILSIFMWILTVIYAGVQGYWYPVDVMLLVPLILVLYTFISSSLMIYITTLLKSVNAFGTLSGILGTLIGFASGIYMPLVYLGETTTFVASINPFTHMAIWLKTILLKSPIDTLSHDINDPAIMAEIKTNYGLDEIGVLGLDLPLGIIFIGIGMLAILFLYLAFKNMTKKMNKS